MPDPVFTSGSALTEEIDTVIPKGNFKAQGAGTTDCRKVCNMMVNGQEDGYFDLKDKEVLIEADPTCLNKKGSTTITLNVSGNLNRAIGVIDSTLDAGEPVLAAVHRGGNCSIHNDGTTSHFILIVGKTGTGADTVYRYFDPGSHKGDRPENVLRLKNNYLQGVSYLHEPYYVVYIATPK